MMPKLTYGIDGNVLPVARLGASQNVNGTSASAQSTVIDENADSVVLVACSDPVRILVGTNPTAEATSKLLPAGSDLAVLVPANNKIAVLGGVANITVLA